jgi:hypothetical protein
MMGLEVAAIVGAAPVPGRWTVVMSGPLNEVVSILVQYWSPTRMTGKANPSAPGAPTPGLTPCPDCSGWVSRRASQCPHCGRPLQPEVSGSGCGSSCGCILLALTVFFVIMFLKSCFGS